MLNMLFVSKEGSKIVGYHNNINSVTAAEKQIIPSLKLNSILTVGTDV